jgi:hypothetical protein
VVLSYEYTVVCVLVICADVKPSGLYAFKQFVFLFHCKYFFSLSTHPALVLTRKDSTRLSCFDCIRIALALFWQVPIIPCQTALVLLRADIPLLFLFKKKQQRSVSEKEAAKSCWLCANRTRKNDRELMNMELNHLGKEWQQGIHSIHVWINSTWRLNPYLPNMAWTDSSSPWGLLQAGRQKSLNRADFNWIARMPRIVGVGTGLHI